MKFPARSMSNFIFWFISILEPSPQRNVSNGATVLPRRSQLYISSRRRNEAYNICDFRGLNASCTARGQLMRRHQNWSQTCMTLALTSPTHPTGFSPVSSSNSTIFAELADEGEREPAAYSPYEESCELQNARAEMIPALGVHDQFPFSVVSLISKSIGKSFTFEPVSTFLRWRCQ